MINYDLLNIKMLSDKETQSLLLDRIKIPKPEAVNFLKKVVLNIYFYNNPDKDKSLSEQCERVKNFLLETAKVDENVKRNLEMIIILGNKENAETDWILAAACVQRLFPKDFATAAPSPVVFSDNAKAGANVNSGAAAAPQPMLTATTLAVAPTASATSIESTLYADGKNEKLAGSGGHVF